LLQKTFGASGLLIATWKCVYVCVGMCVCVCGGWEWGFKDFCKFPRTIHPF